MASSRDFTGMQKKIRIDLFGTVVVDPPIRLRTPRYFDLLLYLLCFHDELVERSKVASDLWPRERQRQHSRNGHGDKGMACLRRCLSDVHNALAALDNRVITQTRTHLCLNSKYINSDLIEFELLLS